MDTREARVLIYDIETSPLIGYTWSVWETNVIDILEEFQILTFAWKWLGEKQVHVLGQDDTKGYKPGVNNDKELVKKLHQLFDEADIVVAHNGNSFDQKKVQTRMMIHGMRPPSPYKQIDTKLVAKRYAAFSRNNLKWLAKDLKTHNQKGDPGGFETWQGCMAGDKKAWRKMKKYNKGDITSLEDLYLEFLPWMTNHPNMARIKNLPDACPKCGTSGKMQSRGTRVTNVGKYFRYQCQHCGGWGSSRTAFSAKEDVKPSYVNFPN